MLYNQNSFGERWPRAFLSSKGQTKEDETVTIRYRDDMRQERIKVAEAVDISGLHNARIAPRS